MNKIFLKKILDLFKDKIIPLTNKRVLLGNKIFGSAIINKKDFSIIIVDTNNEIKNPLFHGEITTINKFYQIPKNKRPNEKDCFFISSHEPCSLCLSAITWSGFDNFYYLYSYKDTQDKYKIPHDLKILKEVFGINKGKYKNNNYYWKSYNIKKLIKKLSKKDEKKLLITVEKINESYRRLSNIYQKNKKINNIPLK